jgi:hypothetical protein
MLELLGVNRFTLRQWEQTGCVHLGGACLTWVEGPRGANYQPTHYYLETEALRVRDSLRARLAGRVELPGGAHLTMSEARRKLRLDYYTVQALVRSGRVRTAVVPSKAGRGREKRVYCEADLREYLRTRTVPFDGRYPDGRVNLALAAAESGMTRSLLKKYIARGKLSAVHQIPPAQRGRSQPELTVYPADVRQLQQALHDAARAGRPVGDWLPLGELLAQAGARTLGQRILIGACLAEGRRSGALRHRRPDYPVKVKGRQRRRVIFYQAAEAIPYLRACGIPITDVATSVAESPSPSPAVARPAAATRVARAREKHLRWKAWKDGGLSYSQIAQRHLDKTGEEVTRDAVCKAIRRLGGCSHQV